VTKFGDDRQRDLRG